MLQFVSQLKNFRMALKFIDIATNLTDSMYQGCYGSTVKHQADLDIVLKRAWKQQVDKIIISSSSRDDCDKALSLAANDDRLYTTVGTHPTHCNAFLTAPDEYYNDLRLRIHENPEKVIAVGECGLDFDRLHFCDKETQLLYFEKQLGLAAEFKLPLFLHMRNAYEDFMAILERNRDKLQASGVGVVHSFTGTLDEAKGILAFGGLYIGINGCSLKTEENLQVVKSIPNECILLETDCPWCCIRPSHASFKYVKTKFPTVKKKEKWTVESLIDGRNEPCQIQQVLEAVAGIKEQPIEQLAEIYYQNTLNLFFSRKKA